MQLPLILLTSALCWLLVFGHARTLKPLNFLISRVPISVAPVAQSNIYEGGNVFPEACDARPGRHWFFMPPQRMPKIKRGPYTVEQSPAVAFPLEIHSQRFKTSIVVTWSLWILYLVLQFRFASLILGTAPHFIWQLWIAFLAEFVLTFQDAVTALNIVVALFSVKDTGPRPSYRLTGIQGPSVDVLVTCCGEPVDVIVNTVAAAASQDYPREQLRVFLLDDGHDQGLRQAVTMLNTCLADRKKPQIIYLSRRTEAGTKSFFKAGNLRYGIDESHRQGSSELLAGLDADMISRSDWLRKMVPHLLLDDKLALACPPQVKISPP